MPTPDTHLSTPLEHNNHLDISPPDLRASPQILGHQHESLGEDLSNIQQPPLDLGLPEDYLAPHSPNGFSFTDAFALPLAPSFEDKNSFELDFDSLQALMQAVPNVPLAIGEIEPIYEGQVSSRFEYFKRSPWLWTPAQFENAFAGPENLRVNENAVNSMLSQSPQYVFAGNFTQSSVDSTCRDRIMFMIYSTLHDSALPLTFPSESYLDRMVQIYFGCQSLEPTTWIHTPSFFASECETELLAAIIGAGASLVSIPSVCRMGYALQERSRLSLSALIERDNSKVRQLQTIQAYLLWVSIGLWSGFKRNMEVAETFLSAPVTVGCRNHLAVCSND
ncbi:unnamed protein product [Penicillium salamii]|nr:unnamed protein product [Penicillium salamii]